MITIIACLRHIYMGVLFRPHPIHGESHIQHNTKGEVATVSMENIILNFHCKQMSTKNVVLYETTVST